MKKESAILRLFRKIQRDDVTGCWNFSSTDDKGYGRLTMDRKWVTAHRAAYSLLVGEIPAGIHIHHKCENRRCCNPDHLQLVTPKEHNRISPRNLVSIALKKTHCPKGHPLIQGNLVLCRLKKGRVCLTCQRAAIRAAYYKDKQKWNDRIERRRLRDPKAFAEAQMRYQAAYRNRNRDAMRLRDRERRKRANKAT